MDDPFLPVKHLSVHRQRASPIGRGTQAGIALSTVTGMGLACNDRLGFLTVLAAIFESSLVSRTDGHNFKHPEHRLIERQGLLFPLGVASGAPGRNFPQMAT